MVGPVAWPMIVEGVQDFLRLLASATEPPDARTYSEVRRHNPLLGPEDVAPVATLWAAFPSLSGVLTNLGSMDDLVAVPPSAAPGVARVRAVLHVDPRRMQARYPELADYVTDLDRLFEADVRWIDSQNRTLALLHVDTESSTLRFELQHADGLLLPSRAGQALADQALSTQLGTYHYAVLVSANVRAFGVALQLRDARASFEHERSERGMALRARVQHVPKIAVTGAALGFIPTGLIDAVIPGDIQGLAEKSLHAACEGNHGRGVELDARFDRRPGGNATVSGQLALETIDNFLVKLGAAHFSHHILPDEDVRADLSRLLRDAQRAFSADLERYALEHAR